MSMSAPTALDAARGRTTLYEGVRMRSRLEAAFAAWLDLHSVLWEYEPHVLANAHGQYLPDFLALVGVSRAGYGGPSQKWGGYTSEAESRQVYFEVKPTWSHAADFMTTQQFDVLRKSVTMTGAVAAISVPTSEEVMLFGPRPTWCQWALCQVCGHVLLVQRLPHHPLFACCGCDTLQKAPVRDRYWRARS